MRTNEVFYTVRKLLDEHGKALKLEVVVGARGFSRRIRKAEVQRPGLGLTGFLERFDHAHIWVFGQHEIDYLSSLDVELRAKRLRDLLPPATTMVLLAKDCIMPAELQALCQECGIPLFRSQLDLPLLLNRMNYLLSEELCPVLSLHGTLVEVFGVGVLIQGESSVGKSEAALGLIEKGHRLISDDNVYVRKTDGHFLVGKGPELTRHLMEVRGIGIINIAHLYGAVSVRPNKTIDMVVNLEPWDDNHFYDRVGLDERFIDMLDLNVPYHLLPVKPGRDVVLLLETLALNHRLKEMGYHSAQEFNTKLLEIMERKRETRKRKIKACTV